MENEIIMETEQVMDEAADIAMTEGSAKDLLLVAGIGAGVIVGGVIIYKKVIKPLVAKAKKKKDQDQDETIDAECAESENDEVETEQLD